MSINAAQERPEERTRQQRQAFYATRPNLDTMTVHGNTAFITAHDGTTTTLDSFDLFCLLEHDGDLIKAEHAARLELGL